MRFFPSKRLIFVLIGLIWFQLSFLPLFSVGQIKPDFFFMFIVYYAFRIDWKRVVSLAFLVGLLEDLMTNSFFGLETASYVGGAILLRFIAIRFERDKLWIQLASLFCFSWTALILFLVVSALIHGRFLLDEWGLVKTFLISAYTTAVGSLAFPLFEKWLRPALKQRQYELF